MCAERSLWVHANDRPKLVWNFTAVERQTGDLGYVRFKEAFLQVRSQVSVGGDAVFVIDHLKQSRLVHTATAAMVPSAYHQGSTANT